MQHKVSYFSRQSAFIFLLFISALLFFTTSCNSSTVNNEPTVTEPDTTEAAPEAALEAPLETAPEVPAATEPANPEEREPSQPAAPTAAAPTTAGDTATPPIVISKNSIGNIDSNTPFDVAEIQASFPGRTVTEDSFSAEGVTYPAIKVSDGEGELLTITALPDNTTIDTITSSSPQVINSLGHDIGTPFSDVFDNAGSDCVAGVDAYQGKAMCFAPDTDNIQYVFDGPSDSTYPGILPPTETLSSWTIEEIRWWSDSF
ncbi:MAG: DUF1131 family protein [Cyanobacteria bacterium J06627_28]